MTARPAALRIAAFLAALLWAGIASADGAGRATAERQFAAFLESLWPEAKAQGVGRRAFDAAVKDLTLDWSLPDLDPRITGEKETGERRQAEFSSPGRYFDEAAIARLAAEGRGLAKTWGKALARIEKTYGVPAEILLAMWARESNYGRAAIPYDALRNLATLSFVGRRKEYFRPELIAALVIIEQGHIARDRLKSSWAGALGHMQMLPSQFLAHAVDFDGDGRKDIWGSVPDALASAANFLKHRGWLPQESWGYEARLSADFDCTLEGPDGRRPLGAWLKLGAAAAGGSVPAARLEDDGFLIMPAGRYGPAFLATRNYYVIKSYNESDLYVIFIGHLADRIAGGRPFTARWGNVSTYTRAEVVALQKKLVAEGYNVGERIDGLIGFRTRVATGLYQRKYGLAFDCWPGPQVLAHTGVR